LRPAGWGRNGRSSRQVHGRQIGLGVAGFGGGCVARIRSVKPALRTSRVVAQWSWQIRYFWVLLWGYLDDKGRGLDLPRAIAADCFPLDEDVTAGKVNQWLNIMAATKAPGRDPPICRYEIGGDRYIHAVNWAEHQKPNRPSPSLHPPCPVHDTGPDAYTERYSERISDPFTESGSESPLSPHMVEGEIGNRRGRATHGTAIEPPSPWCPRHPGGTDQPCHTCRLAREAYNRDRRTGHIPPGGDIAVCPDHPGQPAHNCALHRADRLGAPTPEGSTP
jgi:hypothetical protein